MEGIRLAFFINFILPEFFTELSCGGICCHTHMHSNTSCFWSNLHFFLVVSLLQLHAYVRINIKEAQLFCHNFEVSRTCHMYCIIDMY